MSTALTKSVRLLQVVTIIRRMPKRQKPYVAPTIVLEDMADGEEYSDEDESDGDED